uniref:Protein FAR1-RELATED SEQUENCE n=1 Tax=Lactuca sativa TaxID=4236 RepID=A0A9R1V1C8_LACSA|nr:hypothetical protein LSAT_V11C700369640 [Lactuca sativa]
MFKLYVFLIVSDNSSLPIEASPLDVNIIFFDYHAECSKSNASSCELEQFRNESDSSDNDDEMLIPKVPDKMKPKESGFSECVNNDSNNEKQPKHKRWDFVEKHNHVLVSKENLHLLRVNWNLDVVEQSFIHKLGAYNIGATRAYRLLSSIKGAYNVSGGTITNFKNIKMDLNDAQILSDIMEDRVKYVPNFFFDHKIDKGHVTGLFWADEASRRNYKFF